MSTIPPDPARAPLAERMRPRDLSEVTGQEHLLAVGRPLQAMLDGGHLHSCILWGPPGTGKTTLARLLADQAGARFAALSAVMAGVKDIRAAMDEARRATQPTILFLDEVHRFNKSQQDAFLPYVEDGTVVFVGATTENPAFELNNALLSRARVYVLKALDAEALESLLTRALTTPSRGLGDSQVEAANGALAQIARYADGDARRALGVLEVAVQVALAQARPVDDTVLEVVLTEGTRRFDKGGDAYYDTVSALHKSVRGSDPDAALYWFARLLDGGCDPRYLIRRLIRIASEDIGNADPRALAMTLDAAAAYDRLGSPEGELALAQALVFMACAAKSNAVYEAFGAAQKDVQRYGSAPVPDHLRNAPTRLAKAQGHGEGYRYDHDAPEGVAFEQTHFPEDMDLRSYYHPVPRGLEIRIGERLAQLRSRRGRKA
ncbi:MAG: replication-associated recombination protein A [Pseudomonadota bacterium]